MSEHKLTPLQIQAFARHLLLEEKSAATMEKYLRDIRAFACWLGDREICKELTAEWKAYLAEQGYAPASINAMLSALNSLLAYLDLNDCRVKFLKIQRRLFRDDSRELTRPEYLRLLETARTQGRERLALLLETICGTGIRVSEVRYVTVEAVYRGRAEISLKGKIRTILLPGKLLPQAPQIRQETKNRFRRDFSHQKRKRHLPPADLGGDESAVRQGGRGTQQGVSPQSAAPVRQDVLPCLPGRGQAGGRPGPLQY